MSLESLLQESVKRLRQRQERIKNRLLKIPAVQLVVHITKGLGVHDASHMAAGVAYYAVLSLFPLILGLISVLGFFLPSETVQEELFDFFRTNLPESIDVLERNIEGVIQLRGPLGLLSLLGLLWSGSAMFGAISRAINRASNIRQERPFLIRKLHDVLMALSMGILLLLSLGMTSIFTILSHTSLPLSGAIINFAAILLALLVNGAIFLLMYKLIPNVKTYWRYVWPGAVLAAFLFEVAKIMFLLYLSHFANYELIYGSVGSVIVLLLWIYISAFILILGAEFNYQYGLMREERHPRYSCISGTSPEIVTRLNKQGSI